MLPPLMILITAKDLTKSFGARPLFQGLSFTIETKERVGLIGPNGAGKSTLLRILANEIAPDGGELSFSRGTRIGFLAQTPSLPLQQTVEDAVLEGGEKGLELLSKLALGPFAKLRLGELSGGWQKRVALARELVKEPQLLLLDEPTNHLDVESILWLETFLARADFATITVTHDRLFLQRVANRILELDRRNPNGLMSVRGDYATYLERKSELLALQATAEEKLQNKLRRETEWLRQGAKARTTKQQARIRAAGALKEAVEELEFRNQSRSARLEFQSSDKKPKRLIEARQISKTVGGKVLFKNCDLFLGPGDRIGLLGANGCGKSTLIRTLLSQEAPDSGELLRSEHLKVAYFEQNRETLNPEETLKKTLCPHGEQVNYRGRLIHIHTYLDRFLFRREQADMAVGKLSGGEQSRVLLARLMLHEANVLVLDEPTNDLDVDTLDVLSDCLLQFDGAVLLVTHDRYFLDEVATQIIAFTGESAELLSFADLSQWENWYQEKLSVSKRAKLLPQTASPVPAKKKNKLSFKEQREYDQIEGKILEAESRLEELKAEAEKPENASRAGTLSELYQEIAKKEADIETLYQRWSELEASCASFDEK